MEMCPAVRNFFARRSQFDAGIQDVFQGKLAKHGGKRAGAFAVRCITGPDVDGACGVDCFVAIGK